MAISAVPQLGNYVKFVRSTSANWESLLNKDADTLYFIVDAGSVQGALYLGEILIAGAVEIPKLSLSDLEDTTLASLEDQDIIIYNKAINTWRNVSLAEAISDVVTVMVGATDLKDGSSGLVPQPLANQHNLFLRGDGTWKDPTAELSTTVGILIGQDTNQSIREIARSEVATLTAGAPEAFDTFKEVADWIGKHPNLQDTINLGNRVTAIETTLNGVDGSSGLVKTVSDLNVALFGEDGTSGLQGTVIQMKSSVKDLQTALTTAQGNINNHETRITNIENTIQETLVWHTLEDDSI